MKTVFILVLGNFAFSALCGQAPGNRLPAGARHRIQRRDLAIQAQEGLHKNRNLAHFQNKTFHDELECT